MAPFASTKHPERHRDTRQARNILLSVEPSGFEPWAAAVTRTRCSPHSISRGATPEYLAEEEKSRQYI